MGKGNAMTVEVIFFRCPGPGRAECVTLRADEQGGKRVPDSLPHSQRPNGESVRKRSRF